MDNFICPLLHNQIHLGNKLFHNLLEYGNEYIKNLSVDEDKDRNSLLLIYLSINETISLREEFNVSDEGKELNTIKNIRTNGQASITHMTDENFNRDF